MKYLMKQKWFATGNNVLIFDEKGLEAFRLGGEPFIAGKKLSFRDRKDNELAFISQKMTEGATSYEIYHGDDLQAIVQRDRIGENRCKLGVDSAPDELHAEGNFSDHEYSFTREGRPVGRVSKSLFAKNGTYGVHVGRGEDELLLLAGAVVIDLCCQGNRKAAISKTVGLS